MELVKAGRPSKAAGMPDLSVEITRAVQREPGDVIRCRRVSATTYRCNWLTPDRGETDSGLRFLDTYRIRDSKFLRATQVDGRLVIEDLTIHSN